MAILRDFALGQSEVRELHTSHAQAHDYHFHLSAARVGSTSRTFLPWGLSIDAQLIKAVLSVHRS